jgi:hypothetical protein
LSAAPDSLDPLREWLVSERETLSDLVAARDALIQEGAAPDSVALATLNRTLDGARKMITEIEAIREVERH